MADLTKMEITDYHKRLIADTAPSDTVSLIATNGKRDEQIPIQAIASYVGGSSELTGRFATKNDISEIQKDASSAKEQSIENAQIIETLLQRITVLENQLRMV